MSISIPLRTTVTLETLDSDAYLLANPDVRRAGMAADTHFVMYGEKEGRTQINREAIDKTSHYRQEKWQFFKDVLVDQSVVHFPWIAGQHHFSLDQYASESANGVLGEFTDALEANPDKRYLDIGCGRRDTMYKNCLYIEVYPSLSADLVVSPDLAYPFHNESFDGIGCFAVLEHVKNPHVVAAEIRRMLKPGGTVFIDYPFLQPVHGYPNHYFNATRQALASLFSDGYEIQLLKTFPWQGPNYTAMWIMSTMISNLQDHSLRDRVLGMQLGELLTQPVMGPLWMDIIAALPEHIIETLACGNVLIARKNG